MASAASLQKQLQQMYVNGMKDVQKMVNQGNETEMKFNAQEAATARDWQEKMSNTSHQREVDDLKSAGLNPVLSANSGAQSYTTSAASMSAESGANSSGSMMSSMLGSIGSFVSSKYSADTSAAATRYAANQSLKAAQASAAATRYAADRQSANLDKQLKYDKWKTQYQINHSKEGFIMETLSHVGDNVLKAYKNNVSSLKPKDAIYSRSEAIDKWSKMKSNKSAMQALDRMAVQMGYVPSTETRKGLFMFTMTGKDKYLTWTSKHARRKYF